MQPTGERDVDRWVRIGGLLLLLAVGATSWLWVARYERRQRQELTERVATKVLGESTPAPRPTKVRLVLQAVVVLAVVELIAHLTGTDDELHSFLRSCSGRRRGPFD